MEDFIKQHKFSVAPMLDVTDKHCRFFYRALSKKAYLYTEMITTGALIHNDPARFLEFNQQEHPIALQLGGSSPQDLQTCCKIADEFGYDSINLNLGCPSSRVQNNQIGACLMKDKVKTLELLSAMKEATDTPITAKIRLGVDDLNSFEYLAYFVTYLLAAKKPIDALIIHARAALLNLSPKDNRAIPPLKYSWVYDIKKILTQNAIKTPVYLNGGLNLETAATALIENHIDGVMLGRAITNDPSCLLEVDARFYADANLNSAAENANAENTNAENAQADSPNFQNTQNTTQTDTTQVFDLDAKKQIIRSLYPYIEEQLGDPIFISQKGSLKHISRHFINFFKGEKNSKYFRNQLSLLPKNAKIKDLEKVLNLL